MKVQVLSSKFVLVSILFLFLFAGCTDSSNADNEEVIRHLTVLTEKVDDISKDIDSLQKDVASIQSKVGGQAVEEPKEAPVEKTVGNFIISGDDPCPVDGKPVVYMFSSKTCPYCTWEKPVMANTTELFGDEISYLLLEGSKSPEQRAIFDKYNPRNSVPTIVLNCEYYRVGARKSQGYEVEAQALTQLICDITDNKPSDVCKDYV